MTDDKEVKKWEVHRAEMAKSQPEFAEKGAFRAATLEGALPPGPQPRKVKE